MSEIMSDYEAMEIFKRYDTELYRFYMNHGMAFGLSAKLYAERLKERFEVRK